MYTHINFPTKKALKAAVAAWQACEAAKTAQRTAPATLGAVVAGKVPDAQPVTVYQPGGIYPTQRDGVASIEGPHAPKPHRWYARVQLRDGYIVKVLP